MDPNGIETTGTGISVEQPSLQVDKDGNKSHTIETVNYYKIPANRSYIDIKDGTVIADKMSCDGADESKKIRKVILIETSSVEKVCVNMKVALFSESFSKYIVVRHGDQVGLDDSPMWYVCNATDNYISFKIADQFEVEVFLAFDAETCRIVAQPSEFHFIEFPAPETYKIFSEVRARTCNVTV